jgi:hypothetical protein
MSRIILSWKAIIGLSFVVMMVVVLQSGLASSINRNVKIWEGTPVFAGWQEKGDAIQMKLICDGKEGFTVDLNIIKSQITSPDSPLPNSVLYRDGKIELQK